MRIPAVDRPVAVPIANVQLANVPFEKYLTWTRFCIALFVVFALYWNQ
jgi:hypothetical protein